MGTELTVTQSTAIQERGSGVDVSILAGMLSPSSLTRYRQYFGSYVDFAGSMDRATMPETLAAWRQYLVEETEYKPSYINTQIYAVKRVMQEAGEFGYISREDALAFAAVKGVKPKALKNRGKPGKRGRTRITPDAMRALVEAPDVSTLVGLRDRAMLLTLATAGLRVGEMCHLKRGDIEARDGGYVVLVMGKNATEPEEAPIAIEAVDAIDAWLGARTVESEFVFTSFVGRSGIERDRPISSPGAWMVVQKYAGIVGLSNVKPHDFRRFVGTQLAASDIRSAQKALRHKDIRTTATHYVLDDLKVGLTDGLF